MSKIRLNVQSPSSVDDTLRQLIGYLGLNESDVAFLEATVPADFEPEANNCHFNVWVQCDIVSGCPQHGWILAQDKSHDFTEAQFHTVWKSPSGELIDLTPRIDGEQQIMFIPDASREIELSEHQGAPALLSYDNVRIHHGRIITELARIKIVPQSEMIYKYGLAQRGETP